MIFTESLVSARSGATKDWSITSEQDEIENARIKTPTKSRYSFEQSFRDLAISTAAIADDEEDDGYGSWITPSNIKKHKIRDSTTSNSIMSAPSRTNYSKSPRRQSDVSSLTNGAGLMKAVCMTADFAMQNVALQMGLNLVNVEGEMIKQVKTWVLRCHGCFTYLSL